MAKGGRPKSSDLVQVGLKVHERIWLALQNIKNKNKFINQAIEEKLKKEHLI